MELEQLLSGLDERWIVSGICLFLAAIVWIVFGQTLGFDFVNYGDAACITGNPAVQKGVTLKGLVWALSCGETGHWHPLTWLTHMLDCQVYGLWAGGHHLTNVLIHGATVLGLFLVLRKMTGSLWRSALVAALWAVHPLRAGSVAWVAEREDVLSGLFFVLTLAAYVRYARRPGLPRYLWVAALFALGLLANNMLVTLPCLLLLLDYWPLRRTAGVSLSQLFIEKLPLFALSTASCLATFLMSEKLSAGERLPLPLRLENAAVSCVIYLWQTVWPANLAAPCPDSRHLFSIGIVIGALALMAAISAAAVILRERSQSFFTGWFWFAGMLAPVIGLVRIPDAAHAGHCTYLPQIGLFIAAAWALPGPATRPGWPRWMIGMLSAGVIVILVTMAQEQTSWWHDSESLWTHTLACVENNEVAHKNLGDALKEKGDLEGAIAHYQKAVEIRPDYTEARNNLGDALTRKGDLDEAIVKYQKVVEIEPGYAKACNSLGVALAQKGRLDEAIAQYQKALQIKPDYAEACNNLGNALEQQGRLDEEIEQFKKAVELKPDYAEAQNNLGIALSQKGRLDEAIGHYQKAVEFKPDYAEADNNLGVALVQRERLDEAIACFQKAVELRPDYAEAQNNLGLTLSREEQWGKAIVHYRKAVQIKPGYVEAINNLANLLSTCPDARLQNIGKAEELARLANQLTGGKNPVALGTLAEIYAVGGDFPAAIDAVQQAIQLAKTQGDSALGDLLQEHLKLYKAGQPSGDGR